MKKHNLPCYERNMIDIATRVKHLMGLIEISHGADDKYFLMIHAERCKNKMTLFNELKSGRIRGTFLDLIMVKV